MADGYVQVPPDSSGKKIDSEELTTTSGLVERQRVSVPGDVNVKGDLLSRILVEQRVQNILLSSGLNINDNLDTLRSDLFAGQLALVPVYDLGSISGSQNCDVSVAQKQKMTIGGATTLTFVNWPPTGNYGQVEIQLVNGGSSVTWPTVTWMKGDGTSSTTFSSMGVTLQSSGTNWVIVWSTDGGTTLYGMAA